MAFHFLQQEVQSPIVDKTFQEMIHCRMKSAISLLIFFGNVHSIVLRSRQTISPSSSALNLNSNSPQCFPSRCKTRIYATDSSDIGEPNTSKGDLQATASQDNWELLEDWSLQDKVPEFTLQSSSTKSTTTFWRQLRHTNPELSKRTEQELQERYKTLSTAEPTTREPKDPTAAAAVPFITCGESPEILNDWWMDVVEKKSSAIMMMYGRLPSGSNIWFPLQTAGTVGTTDTTTTNDGFSWLLEEGDFIKYAESSAGCIYELGNQKPGSMTALFNKEIDTKGTNSVSALDNLSSSKTSMGIALSAVVASSLLSASLAFTAGQASLPPPKTPPVSSTAIVRSQAITPAITGSGMKYERTLNRDGTTKIVEMSIGEQRASQELKIYRDERRLGNLQDKLVSDEVLLRELTATEAKLGPEEAGKPMVDIPRSPRELSISEQRARAELKIGSDKRRIVKLKEALSKDKIKLKELQTQEKQQQRMFFR